MERESYCLLVQTSNGRPICYMLNNNRITIGRGAENSINLSDDPISSNHCEIRFSKNTATLKDLGSKNGTQLNGRPLGKDGEVIRDGDTFVVGLTVKMEFFRLRPVDDTQGKGGEGKATSKSKNKPERPVQVINPVAAAVANATRKLTEQK